MKHLTNLTIAAGVFIFTKLYADAISFNSIEFSGANLVTQLLVCLLYTSPSPRDGLLSRMPSSA